jgi:AcrR family transcriptional regulator
MEFVRGDRRREAGGTRNRLMDAAVELLAQRGEDGVTLRGVTEAAGANVAAVSYHFGSLRSLCDAAVDRAIEVYVEAQEEALGVLGPASTLEQLASALTRPILRALALGGRELAMMRVVARARIVPAPPRDHCDPSVDDVNAGVVRVLEANLPAVKGEDLILRARCVAGLLHWIAIAPADELLGAQFEAEIERQLLSVTIGAFRGLSSS